jgi:AraC family transcriptional regulator
MLTNPTTTKSVPHYASLAMRNSHHLTPSNEGKGREAVAHPARRAFGILCQVRPEPTVEVSPADIVKRRTAAWKGMRAEIVQVTRRERMEVRFRAQSHLLVIYGQGARSDGETMVEGLARSTLRDVRHKLTFVPAGHEYREWHDPRVLPRVIYLYIDPASVPILPDAEGMLSLSPKLFFDNAALRETAFKLAASIEAGLEDDVSYLEALGAVLVHELVRLYQGGAAKSSQARGGLAGWQQRAVASYIEEHLDQSIPLAKLAALARLSPYYFCRAFKESFGLPPHRYHTSRRIDRAKALLADAKQSVTEIGLSLGFSETSSFTATFRKTTGTTPTGYRKSLA